MYTLEDHKNKKLINLKEMSGPSQVLTPVPQSAYLTESKDDKKRALIVEMEAIHVGKTKNHIFYTEQGLKDGLQSWTHPYQKPVLTHHNQHDGEPIGRILEADFRESPMNGRKGLFFKVAILDKNAQEKVLDGRYQTVSIGSSTDRATCNICGTNRVEEWCEHWKGETYEGVQCHYSTGTVSGIEVSYVNNPADSDAGNVSMGFQEAHQNVFALAEGEIIDVSNPKINMMEQLNNDKEKKAMSLLVENLLSTNTHKENNNFSKKGRDDEMTLEEALALNEKLQKEMEETTNRAGKLSIQLGKLEEQVAEKEQENKTLLEENTRLKKVELKNLIEEVVDMKMALGKPDTVGKTKEELVESHSVRTKESLEDLHGDLLLEKEANQVENSKKKIEDPTLKDPKNEEGVDQEEDKNEVSLDEALGIFENILKKNKGGN